ncbi:hypothetical protein DL89DRAFT_10271 [Linderina pennispora]|uniref:Uncharacterized protein n=1 Tax=Linderina pennispora TaxID=61395 RepID=A0A1Y1WKM5_9FUNG|nr:uncharacterized protein DL89DRAFT_10271 [Linderina pennispora]ORX74131.1 hypothetical protein DL89DRAFT_10271 [Linderina pennispora]
MRISASYLASIWSVFVTTAPICPGQEPCGCPLVESENPKSPHEVLFYAITNNVGTRLAQTVSLGPDVVDQVFPPVDDSTAKVTAVVSEFTSALAALLPATEAEPTTPSRPIPVAHLTNAMTLTLWLNDAIGRNGGISGVVLEVASSRHLRGMARTRWIIQPWQPTSGCASPFTCCSS